MNQNTQIPTPTIPIGTMVRGINTEPNSSNSTSPIEPVQLSIKKNSKDANYTLELTVLLDALHSGPVSIYTDESGLNFYAVSAPPSTNPPQNVVKYTYIDNEYINGNLAVNESIKAYNTYIQNYEEGSLIGRTGEDPDDSPPFEGTVQPAGGTEE